MEKVVLEALSVGRTGVRVWVAGWAEQKPPEALVARTMEKSFSEAEMILIDAAESCLEKSDLHIHGCGQLYENASFCNGSRHRGAAF